MKLCGSNATNGLKLLRMTSGACRKFLSEAIADIWRVLVFWIHGPHLDFDLQSRSLRPWTSIRDCSNLISILSTHYSRLELGQAQLEQRNWLNIAWPAFNDAWSWYAIYHSFEVESINGNESAESAFKSSQSVRTVRGQAPSSRFKDVRKIWIFKGIRNRCTRSGAFQTISSIGPNRWLARKSWWYQDLVDKKLRWWWSWWYLFLSSGLSWKMTASNLPKYGGVLSYGIIYM